MFNRRFNFVSQMQMKKLEDEYFKKEISKVQWKQQKEQIKLPKYFEVKKQQNDSFAVTLHKSYIVERGHKYYQDIETWVMLANQKKDKNAGKGLKQSLELEYYPSFEFYLANCKMEEQMCPICLCEYEIKQRQQLEKQFFEQNPDDIYVISCGHKFHLGCLQQFVGDKKWIKCPICSKIIGLMIGDQPDGDMNVTFNPSIDVPGHGKGAIIINYIMKGGVRKGIHFSGTSRTAYLPNNKEGKEVLQLLKQAFERKLIFTVGRSITTGLDNQTVWNGIHHKTSISGGSARFGYPDSTYLSRVKDQLAVKEITLESINKKIN